LIHEIGHAVDYNNEWLSSTNYFIKAIQLDKNNIKKRYIQNINKE